MKQVELVRQRVIRAQHTEIVRLRQFLSMIGNGEVLPHLEGKEAEKLLASITDAILQHIGHSVTPFAKDGRTQSSKAVKR